MRTRVMTLGTFGLAILAGPAAGQTISIRTVPISQSHQFDLFPSLRGGMGGVSIAVDDTLLDPFRNPAKAGRLRSSQFFGSPGVYSVSSGAGGGRQLPVGAWARSRDGSWFGGAALAVQQIDLSDNFNPFLPPPCLVCLTAEAETLQLPAADRTLGNAFAFAMLGRSIPEQGLSLAASVYWAGLHGVDGTDLLYPGSVRLRQDGHALDLRAGAVKEMAGDRSLSAVLLHSRYASTHDAYYLDTFWDPGLQQFSQQPRLDANLDHTTTWGAHVEYAHPISSRGWRMGWVATANVMQHPKIPNYEIQNIPRDPGNSEAFNLGVGFSKRDEAFTFAFDVLYEPIWSYTWADAAEPVETAAGATIAPGGKTIENRFRFSNAILRMGVGQDIPLEGDLKGVGLQLGLALHRIDYSLVQDDNVQGTTRRLNEDWVEWTPTWGLSVRFPAWEVRYRGSVTKGTGRPGVFGGDDVALDAAAPGRQVLVAPSGPLTLSQVSVMTHQLSLSFPFR